MTVKFNCQHCGKRLNVPDQYAGQAGSCNHCGARITVPNSQLQVPHAQADPIASLRVDTPQLGVSRSPSKRVWQRVPVLASVASLLVIVLGAAGAVFLPSFFAENNVRVSSPGGAGTQILDDGRSWTRSARDASLKERIADLLPTEEEDRFLLIPWRTNLLQARVEASAQQKPMFMWVMNGDPLGCV